jgi:DNA-binding transcriptional ArsR family regulator
MTRTQQQSPRKRSIASADVVDLIGHDLRYLICAAIGRRAATAAEVAATLDVPVSKIRYQLRKLVELGLVESVEESSRRGVIERSYALTGEMFVGETELQALEPEQQLQVASSIVRAIFGDVLRSLRARLINRRPDRCIIRVPLRVDAAGWAELTRIHGQALEKVLRVQDESSRRLEQTDEEAIDALSVLLSIEIP